MLVAFRNRDIRCHWSWHSSNNVFCVIWLETLHRLSWVRQLMAWPWQDILATCWDWG